jgi:hypothetical protein
MVLLLLMVLVWLLVLVVLLLVLVLLMVVATIAGAPGVVEVVLVDKVVLLLLRIDIGCRKSIRTEIITRKVLTIVVGRGVVDVLRLITTTALLDENRKYLLFIYERKKKTVV